MLVIIELLADSYSAEGREMWEGPIGDAFVARGLAVRKSRSPGVKVFARDSRGDAVDGEAFVGVPSEAELDAMVDSWGRLYHVGRQLTRLVLAVRRIPEPFPEYGSK